MTYIFETNGAPISVILQSISIYKIDCRVLLTFRSPLVPVTELYVSYP
jgi:hypothetical protein